MAPGAGLEPATYWLHVISHFHEGMDYLFTISIDVGVGR